VQPTTETSWELTSTQCDEVHGLPPITSATDNKRKSLTEYITWGQHIKCSCQTVCIPNSIILSRAAVWTEAIASTVG
jgi:hypothetical protein